MEKCENRPIKFSNKDMNNNGVDRSGELGGDRRSNKWPTWIWQIKSKL